MAVLQIFIYCFTLLLQLSSCISRHPIIVITAFDGFRYDYMDRGLTPILEDLQKTGVRTSFMYNVFPTVTSPNFFSIATGMYPETHGVVGNAVFNENFECLHEGSTVYELFHYNENIIPLWILNELRGDERYSGTILWPSSGYPYVHRQPTFFENNQSLDYISRVDMTIDWILHEKTPANLIFLYFGQPDWAGHMHGPDSEEVNEKLKEINNVTKYFLQKLSDNKLLDVVNLIFLSDHGMANLPAENVIDFQSFIQNGTYLACGESPVWQIQPKPGYETEIYKNLSQAAEKLNAFTVYKHDEIPDRLHIKNCKRRSDLLLVAKINHGFSDAAQFKGEHGYDPAEQKVHPFFIANGPRFKQNYEVQPFNNIDIYPLLMKILDLYPPPDDVKPNGTLTVINDILRN